MIKGRILYGFPLDIFGLDRLHKDKLDKAEQFLVKVVAKENRS